jgi:hypothetical protein
MSKLGKWGRASAALGVILATLNFVFQGVIFTPGSPLTFLSPVVGFWWLFLATGLAAILFERKGLQVAALSTESSLERQDIIEPTNWARNSTYVLRNSYGISLFVSAVIVLIIALLLDQTALLVLWSLILLVGIGWIITARRYSQNISTHHTETLSVRVPNLFAVHSFHVALRQASEDLGYQIQQNTSPGRGGQSASYEQQIFHANGGFKARHRPIKSSKILSDEIADETYLSKILTVSTLGIFCALFGITILSASSTPLQIVLTTEEMDLAYIFGPLFLLSGLIVTGFDYYTRTREWGELYCVEEGTVYSSSLNIYDQEVLEKTSHNEPTVKAPETSAVLSVTVGAKCTGLYDEEKLTDDFSALADSIDDAADENQFEVVEGA